MMTQKYSHGIGRKKHFPIIICYLIVVFLSSCGDENGKKSLNTSDIEVNFNKLRYDREVYSLDTNNLKQSLNQLGEKYPAITNIYFKRLAGLGSPADSGFYSKLNHFLTYKDYTGLYDSVQKHFPSTDYIDEELTELFKNIKYFYPDQKLGHVAYFISGLNRWSSITIDTTVGIGLDMFLGKDFPYYQSALGLSDYEVRTNTKEYIPIKTAKNLFENTWAYEPEGKTLLDLMLYRGKQLYFMENVLREEKDQKLIFFTEDQLAWCQKNEALLYNTLVKRNVLYSTKWQEILPLVMDGPKTNGMPDECPGNIGSWLGWQIVRTYMNKHSETSLQHLMSMEIDAQKFLFESKFKP